MPRPCHLEKFTSYERSVPRALKGAGAAKVLAGQRRILIKPNLVNASPPPVTLPVEAVEALVGAIRGCSDAEIVVAEGAGDLHLETPAIFRILGYDRLAAAYGLELVDLNEAPLKELKDPSCTVYPSMFLPEILLESYVISFAVLKAHSLADVTLSMKNMIGCAPPSHYQQGGHWKKSAFHSRIHESIFELNRYRKPDIAIIDASVGLAEHHLGGAPCDPPARKIVAGFDPVAVDAAGARLLGSDWRQVGHIRLADGVLGEAEVRGG